jgi:hypothetical protein
MIIADIPEDELALARLAGRKLAKLLHGILTVGLASIRMEQSSGFLTGRDRKILAFVEVLCATSPSTSELADSLREISALTPAFYGKLVRLADWRNLEDAEIQDAANDLLSTYCTLLCALRKLLDSLGVQVDFSREQTVAKEFLTDATANLAQATVA